MIDRDHVEVIGDLKISIFEEIIQDPFSIGIFL